jgi:hypothetical protein
MRTGFSRIAIKFFLILVPVAIVTTGAAIAYLGYLRYQETRENPRHRQPTRPRNHRNPGLSRGTLTASTLNQGNPP